MLCATPVRSRLILQFLACAVVITLAGCKQKTSEASKTPAPQVAVASPTSREVTHYETFTGRVESPQSVEVRARVSGYLKKIFFKPGVEVPANAPLLEIDTEPFKAELARAEAELSRSIADIPVTESGVARAEAKLVRATADLKRSEQMLATNAMSREEYDKSRADKLEAEAELKAVKAKVDVDRAKVEADRAKVRTAQLNLGYCTMTAPVAGRVGDRLVTEGNLIIGGAGSTTLLTTIVSVDPMYVAFDVDENTLQRVQKAEREGLIELKGKEGEIPAEISLAVHGPDYPVKGTINFVNNQVDPKTGTIRVKAECSNPKPQAGTRLLTDGMFARIRLPIDKPFKAMLIPDSAVLSDQGVSYALVVGADSKATRFDLDAGSIVDGYRVVNSVRVPGETKSRPLQADDKIIVSGLQRVRAGMIVDPKPAASR